MKARQLWHVPVACTGCPFRRDKQGVRLYTERLREILRSVAPADTGGGGEFPCHKTVNYDQRDKATEKQCAGALIYMYKVGASSNLSRIMERMGGIDPDLATGDHPEIFDSEDELLAHALDERPKRRRR